MENLIYGVLPNENPSVNAILSRNSLAMVVLVVAVAATISVISYEYSMYTSAQIEELAVREIRSSTDIQAHDLANSLSNRLGDITDTLQIISKSPSVIGGDLEGARPMFDQAEDSSPELIDFYMWLDKAGRLVWISNINQTAYQQFQGTDLSYRLYFTSPRETRQAYYSSVIDSNDSVTRLYISYPVLDGAGRFVGLAAAGIRSDVIGQFMEDQLSPNLQSEVGLLDNTGIVLYSKDPQYVGRNVFGIRFQSFLASLDAETQRAMNEGFTEALAGNPGARDVMMNEERATFAYKPIMIEGKQFGVLYIVTSHAYASGVTALIDQQKNFSVMLVAVTAAAAVGAISVILVWNKRLEGTVSAKTAELKAANEQLQANDRMQREFIDIAAHELRTPIQPILGVAEMLESELGEREDVRMIARNARRLERLTQDLLDVAKIESQSLKLNKERFDIGELVSVLVKDHRRRTAGGHGTVLEYEPNGQGIVVEADRERITQVISNLLDNALKFTQDGRVGVTARKEDDGSVSVSVKDTGIGIAPDIMPRLFSKFASKSQRGTGLGLFISKSIVEAHGGEIWGTNNEGESGATFTFTIP